MLIGGVGGICKTGDDGVRVGYDFAYVQTVVVPSVDIGILQGLEYKAFIEVQEVGGSDFVSIDDVTYFQVSLSKDGNASVNATVRNVEKWGKNQTEYPNLLNPSSRAFRVIAEVSYAGNSLTVPMFTGNITGYSESVGRGGNSISITAKPLIQRIGEQDTTQVAASDITAYLTFSEECSNKDVPTPHIVFFDDFEQNRNFFYNRLPALARILWGWTARITDFAGGVMIAGGEGVEHEESVVFNDSNVISETRSINEARYNAVRVSSLSTGSLIQGEVVDVGDIADRGKIYAPERLFSRDIPFAELEATAALAISGQLNGQISIQVRFNPLLFIGMNCSFSGDKINISGVGEIVRVSHQYRYGTASTNLAIRVA